MNSFFASTFYGNALLAADVPTARTLNMMLFVFVAVALGALIFFAIKFFIALVKRLKFINETVKDGEKISFFSNFFSGKNNEKHQFVNKIDKKNDFKELENLEKTIELNISSLIEKVKSKEAKKQSDETEEFSVEAAQTVEVPAQDILDEASEDSDNSASDNLPPVIKPKKDKE